MDESIKLTEMEENIEYFTDMDAIEKDCVAMKLRTTVIYCYPPTEEVLSHNPKVLVADGRVVKRAQVAIQDDVKVIVGELDGERLVWDMDGFLIGNTEDKTMRVVIPERYWDKNWKTKIHLSNGEWYLKYGRPHPTVKIPKEWDRYKK